MTKHEIALLICELTAACLYYSLIVMQFFLNNFILRKKLRKTKHWPTVSSILSQQTFPSNHIIKFYRHVHG
jgi:hypothetical protein